MWKYEEDINVKSISGITLVTLVITILILIILVSVTTTILISSNGTLQRSIWAKDKVDVLKFKEDIEEKISMFQVEQERSGNISFKDYIMKKFSIGEDYIEYYDAAKAVAFYYQGYYMVIEERDLELKCIGTDVMQEQNVGVVYKDILNEGFYILKVKKKPNWNEFWTKADYFKKIKTVVVEKGVTTFGSSTCSGASSVENVYLPEGIIELGQSAFEKTNIKEIYLPSTLQYIGVLALSNCKQLERVYMPKDMIKISERAFRDSDKLDNIIIPNGITTIEKQTFYGCRGLTNIILPNTIEEFGELAFFECTKLNNVVIPDNVTEIPRWGFRACWLLENIELSESLTIIEDSAFYHCYVLKNIYIPKSLTTVKANAFWNVNLSKIYYGGTKEDWTNIAISEQGTSTFTQDKVYYYSEMQPAEQGKYWHYVNNIITEW